MSLSLEKTSKRTMACEKIKGKIFFSCYILLEFSQLSKGNTDIENALTHYKKNSRVMEQGCTFSAIK